MLFGLVYFRFFSASASAASPEFTDGIKTLESSLNETQEQTKDELKGIIAKTRQMIQDKVKYCDNSIRRKSCHLYVQRNNRENN